MPVLIEVMTPQARYERAVDRMIRHRATLVRQHRRALFAELTRLRQQLIGELADRGSQSDFDVWMKQRLIMAVERTAQAMATSLRRSVTDGMMAAWQASEEGTAASLSYVGVQLPPIGIDPHQIIGAREAVGHMIVRVSADFRSRAVQVVEQAMYGNRTPWSIIQELGRLLALEPGRQGMGDIAYQAERIQRTEMMRTFNLADQMQTAELEKELPGLRKRWDATQDDRTRETHQEADQRYAVGGNPGPIPVKQDFIVGGFPAAGPYDPRLPAKEVINCRCVRRLLHPDWE